MGQPSLEPNDKLRLQTLEDQVRELYRRRSRQMPNLGHLEDVKGYGALNGHALMYDQLTGTWKPVLSPPLVTFNFNGTLSVASTDRFPCGAAGRVIQSVPVLTTAGSTTTTALLKHTTANGATTTTLATYSFTSGNKTPSSYPSISFVFAVYDWLWLDVTAAGTGAAGLVDNVWATAA